MTPEPTKTDEARERLDEVRACIMDAKTVLGPFSVKSARKPTISHAATAIWKLSYALDLLARIPSPSRPVEPPITPTTGDFWWIANDGESGFGDPYEAYEAATDYGGNPDYPVQLSRATSLPDVWAVRIVLTRDEDGDPDDTSIELFATRVEADAAIAAAKKVQP